MSALHELEATPATVHRGCFDPSLAPVLTVRSGDLVHPGPREGARDDLLVPGITAILTPGHTPGHQSFVVECQDGRGWVFPFDAPEGDRRRARPAARPRPRSRRVARADRRARRILTARRTPDFGPA